MINIHRRPKNILEDWVSVRDKGAVGDGTDATTAFENAITEAGADGVIYVPSGLYLLSRALNFLEGQQIKGDGYWSILYTTSNIAMVNLHDYCTVGDVQLLGSYDYDTYSVMGNPVDAAISSQKGIFWTQKIGIIVENVWCENLGGYGVDFTTNTTVGRQYTSSIVNNVFATHCLYGVRGASQGEFVTLTNVHSTYNAYGLRLDSGNIHVNASNLSGCIRNVWITAGTNNGKHIFSGCTIAHASQYMVYIVNIDNGSIFNACQMSYGVMYIRESQVDFTGCEIHFLNAVTDLIQCGASQVKFNGITWGSLRPTISDNQSSAGYSDITFTTCKQKGERWIASTTNATPATVFSRVMVDNQAFVFEVEIMAYDPTGVDLVGKFRRKFGVNKGTGAPTVSFTEDVGTDYIKPAFAGIDVVDAAISGSSVVLQGTGLLATNLRWKASLIGETYLN
jgi:hypothetical protein